ncbi:MAG: HD domain-containing phosphohydrolase [Candidatus Cryosericum sp.]
MSDRLNRGAFAYIVLSICLAIGTFVVAGIVPMERVSVLGVWFAMILVYETVADLYPIVYFGFGDAQTEVTVSLGITFAVACIWPPEQAMLLVLIQTIISDLITHKSIDKVIFNAALYATVIGGTSIIYHHFALSQVRFLEGSNLLAVGLAAVYYIVAESVMLSCLFSTLSHRPLLEVLFSFFKQSWLDFAALLPLGMVMTALFRENPLSILFLVPTFLLLYFSLKREQALRNQTQAILEKLVDVLESKSPETAQHSKRVRAWVDDMCNRLGMESSEADMVLQAAVLHDLGKVGLNDDLLRKPGLSAEEFHHIMEHPGVSAGLLEGLTLFQGGREIVLHHHERYDGNGYPDHLAGENIPLGARIIAVADSFDAMVSVRPYRAKSLTVAEALSILDQERGAQFDPELVITFTKIVHEHIESGDMTNFPSAVLVDATDGVSIPAGIQS